MAHCIRAELFDKKINIKQLIFNCFSDIMQHFIKNYFPQIYRNYFKRFVVKHSVKF